jgi:hypothetical protein
MAQMPILGELPDSPPPHRMWLRLYLVISGKEYTLRISRANALQSHKGSFFPGNLLRSRSSLLM